jgi:hypothetical protein
MLALSLGPQCLAKLQLTCIITAVAQAEIYLESHTFHGLNL